MNGTERTEMAMDLTGFNAKEWILGMLAKGKKVVEDSVNEMHERQNESNEEN